jgi:hypothetical protein
MKYGKWRFADSPNVMVITTKNIMYNKNQILSVYHDFDDGMWQFLDGTDVTEEEAAIISLEEIIEIDDSIIELSNLPLGWSAWRISKDSEWNRQRNIKRESKICKIITWYKRIKENT